MAWADGQNSLPVRVLGRAYGRERIAMEEKMTLEEWERLVCKAKRKAEAGDVVLPYLDKALELYVLKKVSNTVAN